MIRQKVKRFAVAYGTTPGEFEQDMVKKLQEIPCVPEIVYNMGQGHCAYLSWEETEEIPETIRDEMELKGEHYTCRDCPYQEHDFDGRRKYFACRSRTRTELDATACEYFYRKVANGEVTV